MSDVRFTDLPVITAARSGDVLAVDNLAEGSAQIETKDLTGGRVLKSGVSPLTGADSSSTVTIGFGSTLPEIPDHVELQFTKLSTAPDIVSGNLLTNLTTDSQFQIQLPGILSDGTSYFVYWKAISIT